jgi:hypothetical protein
MEGYYWFSKSRRDVDRQTKVLTPYLFGKDEDDLIEDDGLIEDDQGLQEDQAVLSTINKS